jgi:hypothetical protein
MITNKSHICTSCQKVTYYENVGSWRNAKTKLNRTGVLRCPTCAGKEGRLASSKKPTGRPVGSKTCEERRKNHARPGNGLRLNAKLTKQQREQGIATRLGYSTYQEYEATLSDWELYKNEVWRITNSQPLHLLENFNKRGASGVEGAYQIDHIYSVYKGFRAGLPTQLVGNIENLQMLPWEENRKKGIN